MDRPVSAPNDRDAARERLVEACEQRFGLVGSRYRFYHIVVAELLAHQDHLLAALGGKRVKNYWTKGHVYEFPRPSVESSPSRNGECETCNGSGMVRGDDCNCTPASSMNYSLCNHDPAPCPDCRPCETCGGKRYVVEYGSYPRYGTKRVRCPDCTHERGK